MYENTENFVDLDFEQHVRQTAYHMWENDGRPAGKETEYWFKAMSQLLAEREPSDGPDGDRTKPRVKTQ